MKRYSLAVALLLACSSAFAAKPVDNSSLQISFNGQTGIFYGNLKDLSLGYIKIDLGNTIGTLPYTPYPPIVDLSTLAAAGNQWTIETTLGGRNREVWHGVCAFAEYQTVAMRQLFLNCSQMSF